MKYYYNNIITRRNIIINNIVASETSKETTTCRSVANGAVWRRRQRSVVRTHRASTAADRPSPTNTNHQHKAPGQRVATSAAAAAAGSARVTPSSPIRFCVLRRSDRVTAAASVEPDRTTVCVPVDPFALPCPTVSVCERARARRTDR